MFNDLRAFVACLESNGELIRVKERLSTQYEIPAAMKFIDLRRGAAVVFENVENHDVPIVGNLLGERKRLEMALGAKGDLTSHYLDRTRNPVRPAIVKDGPVKEIILKDKIDILKTMPVLIHHKKDAGPYMTSAVIIAKDPDTGVRGMGIHRIQVKGKNKLGVLLASPPLSHFFTRAEGRGRPLEVAIVVGMDPVTWFSSVIWAPKGIDKFDHAGALRGEAIPLVRCESVDLEVPAQSEFVLEGKVLPHIREPEGPFGESSGVYLTYDNPIIEIDVATHRKRPLYHALMPFTGEESVLMGVSYEAENLRAIQEILPQVLKIHISPIDFGQMIIQIDKKSEGDPKKVIDFILERNPYTKSAVIIDTDIDPYNSREVSWALSNRFQPDRDIVIKTGVPGSVIDPSTDDKFITSKVGFDATRPLGQGERYERIGLPNDIWSKVSKIMDGYFH